MFAYRFDGGEQLGKDIKLGIHEDSADRMMLANQRAVLQMSAAAMEPYKTADLKGHKTVLADLGAHCYELEFADLLVEDDPPIEVPVLQVNGTNFVSGAEKRTGYSEATLFPNASWSRLMKRRKKSSGDSDLEEEKTRMKKIKKDNENETEVKKNKEIRVNKDKKTEVRKDENLRTIQIDGQAGMEIFDENQIYANTSNVLFELNKHCLPIKARASSNHPDEDDLFRLPPPEPAPTLQLKDVSLKTKLDEAKTFSPEAIISIKEIIKNHTDVSSRNVIGHNQSGGIACPKVEELCSDKLTGILRPDEKTMRDAKMVEPSTNDLVLVERSTRPLRIQKLIQYFFNRKEPDKSIHSDEAIAYVATAQATILTGDISEGMSGLLLLDVAPLSLGIETARGVMTPFFKRNTIIPARQMQTFTMYSIDQPAVTIQVYEGEKTMTKGKHLLEEFDLTGILPAPRGVSRIGATFDIEPNDIPNVAVLVKSAGKQDKFTITNGKGCFPKKDIERTINEAKKFKDVNDKKGWQPYEPNRKGQNKRGGNHVNQIKNDKNSNLSFHHRPGKCSKSATADMMLGTISTFITMVSRNLRINKSFDGDYAEGPDLLELVLDLYVDQSRHHPRNVLEYVEEEFYNHSKRMAFSNDMVQDFSSDAESLAQVCQFLAAEYREKGLSKNLYTHYDQFDPGGRVHLM